jgi:tetratricopeptide (TPR) repeat protein
VYKFRYVVDSREDPSGPVRRELRDFIFNEQVAIRLVQRAARRAEDTDAHKALGLYRQADDYVDALRVLNMQLCGVLEPQDRDRDEWVREAVAFAREDMGRLPPGSSEALALRRQNEALLRLRDFFDLAAQQDLDAALRIVYEELRLLPEGVADVEQARADLRAAPLPWQQLMGKVVLTAAQCLSMRFRELGRDRMALQPAFAMPPGGGGMRDMQRGVDAEGLRLRERADRLRDLFTSPADEAFLPADALGRLERCRNMMYV